MSENILTFRNIMEAKDITETTVPVPKWGGSVVVRSVSYRQMGKIKAHVAASQGVDSVDPDDIEVEKALLVEGLVSPKINEDEAELLMEKSAASVMKVLTAIMGSSEGEEDAVKEAEKSLSDESREVLPVLSGVGNESDSPATPDGGTPPAQ